METNGNEGAGKAPLNMEGFTAKTASYLSEANSTTGLSAQTAVLPGGVSLQQSSGNSNELENIPIKATEVLASVKSITSKMAESFSMLKQEAKDALTLTANLIDQTSGLLGSIAKVAEGTAKGVKDAGNATKEVAEGAEAAGKTTENVVSGVAKAANMLNLITAGIQVAMAVIKLVVGFITGDKRRENQIKEIQKEVDALAASYRQLERAISKSYSSDKYKNLEAEQKNLIEQRKLVEEQKKLEGEKKKTDDGKIKEYDKKLEELNNQIADIRGRQIEAIMGKDVQSAINEFADAYVKAWEAGENKAKAMKDTVRNLFRSAIVQQIKMGLQPQIEKMMNELTDRINQGEEITEKSLDDYVNSLLGSADAKMDLYGKLLNYGQDNPASDKGVTGQLQAAMTEGTGSQLVGLWNMTSNDLREIKIHVMNQAETIRGGWDNVRIISDHTARISQNTTDMSRSLASVDKRLGNMELRLTNTSRVLN